MITQLNRLKICIVNVSMHFINISELVELILELAQEYHVLIFLSKDQ